MRLRLQEEFSRRMRINERFRGLNNLFRRIFLFDRRYFVFKLLRLQYNHRAASPLVFI